MPQADPFVPRTPTGQPATAAPLPTDTVQPPMPSATPASTATSLPTQEPPATEPASKICSPLAGYTLEQLPGLVSNPFHPPKPGSDDPHQGVDLADRLPDTGIAITGRGVEAALAGKVTLAQSERFPYGYAVIIETPLDNIPAAWRGLVPPAGLALSPNMTLTCPQVRRPDLNSEHRSLYVLYAHLLESPLVAVSEAVDCGQALGRIGQSGNALAPHLHLEMRVGPAGWQPESLAHYTNDATIDEMGQYCTWRVSGFFQWIDPLEALALQP